MARGRKTGGRVKGSRNKATEERLEKERIARQAQEEVNKAYQAKTKLGKDVLEDYMMAFHNMAALYQNRIVQTMAMPGATHPDAADIKGFKEWGTLVVDTADRLAQYQSPKFKAIAVVAPSPAAVPANANDGAKNLVKSGDVYRVDDPVTVSKVYSNLIRAVR